MGVSKLLLVDHDVLLPENLKRHALDWGGIAQHKVDVIATAISFIDPRVEVNCSRVHLTGQESNDSVSGVLDRLAQCDLIVDATADSEVFNLLAAIAQTTTRPMVWLEIFGGGFGGFVARSRPNVDPTPQEMRTAYLRYCLDNPNGAVNTKSADYAVESEGGEVQIASDSDVAVIAHHAARLVPDCFRPPSNQKFPYSMYLIGLAKEWVFEAPFSTIPISMEHVDSTGWTTDQHQDFDSDGAEFLLSLLEKQQNATAPAA
jgi:hypothetical protein